MESLGDSAPRPIGSDFSFSSVCLGLELAPDAPRHVVEDNLEVGAYMFFVYLEYILNISYIFLIFLAYS